MQARLGSYQKLTRVDPLRGLHFNGRLLAITSDMRQGRNRLTAANALAYCVTELGHRDHIYKTYKLDK
jgi:hypothetical protein